jgi:hypothetical protein
MYFLNRILNFNQQGFYMTGNHYNDIIEERSCSQVCGYPLCANPLTQVFSSRQKYHISSQFNKVFDVTERKVSRILSLISIQLCQSITAFNKNNSNVIIAFHFSKWVLDFLFLQKFCSNVCFKRSSFFKEQLLSSPLWLREKEDAIRIQFHDEISSHKEYVDYHWCYFAVSYFLNLKRNISREEQVDISHVLSVDLNCKNRNFSWKPM